MQICWAWPNTSAAEDIPKPTYRPKIIQTDTPKEQIAAVSKTETIAYALKPRLDLTYMLEKQTKQQKQNKTKRT